MWNRGNLFKRGVIVRGSETECNQMPDINGTPPVAPDFVIGRLIDSGLQVQVSVRGGATIVMQFSKGPRGFEVAFTPRSIRQLAEMMENAARVAEGLGK